MSDNQWKEWAQMQAARSDERLDKIASDITDIKVKVGIYESVQKDVVELRKESKKITADISALKVKSGIWGAFAGLIPSSVMLIWFWIKGSIGK